MLLKRIVPMNSEVSIFSVVFSATVTDLDPILLHLYFSDAARMKRGSNHLLAGFNGPRPAAALPSSRNNTALLDILIACFSSFIFGNYPGSAIERTKNIPFRV